MFKKAHLGLVTWPVVLASQGADGTFVDNTIKVQLQILKRSELKAIERGERTELVGQLGNLLRQSAEQGGSTQIEQTEDRLDALEREQVDTLVSRIKGWSGVSDEAGEAIAFSAEEARELFEYEAHFRAFWGALLEASRSSRPKN